uniref:Uncharacterized protein n=1 Tax=Rhizophora mucronata TaxID=61149 RepID=A0A2P2R1P7_RHIMU
MRAPQGPILRLKTSSGCVDSQISTNVPKSKCWMN